MGEENTHQTTVIVSDCCKSKQVIEPESDEDVETMGSLWAAYACYICKQCGKACNMVESVDSDTVPPNVRTRYDIQNEITAKHHLLHQLQKEITKLELEDLLFSDEERWYKEKMEEVIISKRPKVVENKLIGRIHWYEPFIDEDTGNVVDVDRSRIIKCDGLFIEKKFNSL